MQSNNEIDMSQTILPKIQKKMTVLSFYDLNSPTDISPKINLINSKKHIKTMKNEVIDSKTTTQH